MSEYDDIAARQIESTGNIVSGYGQHGLATQLWAFAAELRERTSAGREPQAAPDREEDA